MKKFILLFITVACGLQLLAQNISPDNNFAQNGKKACCEGACCGDMLYSGWVIDANLTGGLLMQNITSNSLSANYPNAVNTNISDLKFNDGGSIGIDVQAGYFFGPKQNFGIGAGVMYMNQMGDLTIDHFHTEYQSIDYYGNTFRQVLTSNGQIKESINSSNLNIPIVFKYKTRFTKRVGFTGDAGLLLNVLEKNNYTTNASFDYEAIYKYTGAEGNSLTVYDNSPTPGSSDLLITKAQYLNTTTNGNVQQYFNALRAQGYNVGLGVKPNNSSGSVSYTSPSVGIIIHPALNICLSNHVSMNVGLYYIYQNFSNSAASNYQVTDKVGAYSSLMNSITNSSNSNIGVDLGIRYSFGKHKAPEPVVDTPISPAPLEEEPVASPVTEDEMPAEPERVDISTPILFDVNKTEIKPEAYPVLDEAVIEMNANKNAILVIHGYTDITGTTAYNRALSRKRAVAVKSFLHKRGVKARNMKTIGHGSKNPAASNATREGRAQNRRAVMKMRELPAEE